MVGGRHTSLLVAELYWPTKSAAFSFTSTHFFPIKLRYKFLFVNNQTDLFFFLLNLLECILIQVSSHQTLCFQTKVLGKELFWLLCPACWLHSWLSGVVTWNVTIYPLVKRFAHVFGFNSSTCTKTYSRSTYKKRKLVNPNIPFLY